MGIVDEDVARVRESTDIVKLISGYLQLKKVGRRWQGLCPFHSEKTPSFSVNGEDGLYHCFGCQASGDAITFMREIEHLDFVGAVEALATKAGITLRYTSSEETAGHKRRRVLLDAVESAVEWYHDRLLSAADAGPARSYLRERGLDGEAVRKYKIGWAPDDWDLLAKALRLPDDILSAAGLGFVNRRGRQQDSFRARVLFPIYDVNGAAVGFGGRVMPDGEGPKYKNSQESAIYHKSKLLYGLHWGKDAIVRADEAIVCEGYTDVIGFDQAGLPRAVATCGTALTEDHFRILKRFARRVVLAFDADSAGQAAAERFYEWERQFEIDVAVAALPPGLDPADLAKADPDALTRAVTEAQPFLGFRVDRTLAAADLSTPEGRARGAEQAVAVVKEHPSELVRDQYLMQIADRCGVGIDQLRAMGSPQRGKRVAVARAAQPSRVRRDDIELQVIRLAIQNPEVVPQYVDTRLFASAEGRELVELLLEHPSLHAAIDAADDTAAGLLRELAVGDEAGSEPEALIARLIHDAAVRRLHQLEARGRASGDLAVATDMAALQRGITELRDANWQLSAAEPLLVWLFDHRPED